MRKPLRSIDGLHGSRVDQDVCAHCEPHFNVAPIGVQAADELVPIPSRYTPADLRSPTRAPPESR